MRSEQEIREVFRLHAAGDPQADIARRTGISASHVSRMVRLGEQSMLDSPARERRPCFGYGLCPVVVAAPPEPYAYLLGQYLGDGHIVHNHRGVYLLEIYCCLSYPGIMNEFSEAMSKVLPNNTSGRRRRPSVVAVRCYSNHLPCLFPQHGRGFKHNRPIVLEPWQTKIAIEDCPKHFLRGLVHSDGWRGTNRVRNGAGRRCEYSRYQFTDRSDDIRGLFALACDRLGIEWRRMNRWNIAVSKRQSVAKLDEFIGPKS